MTFDYTPSGGRSVFIIFLSKRANSVGEFSQIDESTSVANCVQF